MDHTIQHNDGSVTIDFLTASSGKKLLAETNKQGITKNDIDVAYMYPKVPEPSKVTAGGKAISYKDVPLGEAKDFHHLIIDKIVKDKPEVVVPNGRLGCKFFAESVSITNTRGIPIEKTLTNEAGESHTFWVYPVYSIEYFTLRPSVGPQLESDLKTLKDYLDRGDDAFLPSEVEYDFLDTIEGVDKVFDYIEENNPVTAWDLETNTLEPERKGAKAIALTISYQEKTGYSIPMEHKEFKWGEGEFEHILERLKAFVADENTYKVGANIGFDIRFLMSVYGFRKFNNHMDIQVAYWMTISQERNHSRRLHNLTYEFTDMGGYDNELEEWVKNYKKEYQAEHKKKPENEIDGSDINYEWIPFDMLFEYAAGDVDATLRIHNVLMEKVKKSKKWIKLYTDFYPRMAVAIARTEANGLNVNLDYAKEIAREYTKEEERLVEAMRSLPSVKMLEDEHREYYERGLTEFKKKPADRNKEIAKWRTKYKKKLEFNPRSGADKGKALYDILNVELPFDKMYVKATPWKNKNPKSASDLTWEDYTTNKDALKEILSGDYDEEAKNLAKLMQEHSSVATLRSNFADKAEGDTADDGAIHGSLNITGTRTGRLSSSHPK